MNSGNQLKIQMFRDHCHYTGECRGAPHIIWNSHYSVSDEIPVVFHNLLNSDYYFIMEEIAEEIGKQFTCLGENIEKKKHNIFSSNRKRSYKNW